MPKTDAPVVIGAAPTCPARAPRRSRRRSPSASRRRSTRSAASTSCAPPPTRATRASRINFTLERDIESATQDVRDKLAQIVNQFPRDTRPLQITEDRSRRAADLRLRRLRPARAEGADRDRREAGQAGARDASRTSARSATTASASARSSCCSTPTASTPTASPSIRSATPSRGRTSRFPAASSPPARPRSRCGRWAGSRTSTTSTASSSPTAPTARSSRSRDVGRVQDTRAGGPQRDAPERHAGDRRARCASSRAPTPSRSSTACRSKLQRIQAQLPQDIQISIGNDQSRFIRRSFEDIKLHLILGGLLASVVVFLFIRNLRVTFIAALAIPTSIIGTFTFMKIARLHAEQHDDARAVAGDRHRHRRRDRRAGEHLPVRRGEGRHAEGSGRRRDRRRSAWR